MTPVMKILALAFAIAVVLGGLPLVAQAPAGPAAPSIPRTAAGTPDLSGYWELRFDSANVPAAKLVPSVTPKLVEAHHEQDEHAKRWCNWLGMPFSMVDYRPLDIRHGRRELAIIFEMQNAVPRHIYLNREAFQTDEIDESTNSTNGVTTARWDGDVLVAETFGWAEGRGVTSIPGGGFRTPTSKLTERFKLFANGQILSVVSTWTDPNVFAAPHTYEYRYYRAPREYEGRRIGCAAVDVDERTRFMSQAPGTYR